MVNGLAKTPRYVLKEGSLPARPPLSPASLGIRSTVIFGFSDKPEYDAFIANSELALTPYPLVKRFLEGHLALDIDGLKLIVIDALSSHQQTLRAATFQSVLSSLRQNAKTVPVTHRLLLDESASAYAIEASADTDAEPIVPSSQREM